MYKFEIDINKRKELAEYIKKLREEKKIIINTTSSFNKN